MEAQKLTELLRATIDPNPEQRKAAEDQLAQIHKIIGFVPTILQIVMQTTLEQPVRQAGAVYLKNLINSSWSDHEAKPGEPIPFSIHEQDRAMIRGTIVDAIVHAPELIRVQLSVCVNHIIKSDFPGRWPQVVDNISIYLQNQDLNGWNGALLTMYQLVKTYEYKRSEERTPLNEAMNLLLPMIYQLIIRLLNEQSEQSVLLQKQILKIYYALTQYSLPLDLITKEIFSQWMEICRQIADREVPDCSHLDEDERTEFPYWKTKKWALHIMVRMFERYGSPSNVVSEKYQKFAEWYLPTFSQGVLEVLLKILDQYRNRVYVSPRVLTDVLNYLKNAVSHAYTWKLIKPHMVAVIQDVIFPIMSFTDYAHWQSWRGSRVPCGQTDGGHYSAVQGPNRFSDTHVRGAGSVAPNTRGSVLGAAHHVPPGGDCGPLLQSPVAALHSKDKMSQPNNEPISSHFIKQWLHDTDCFLGIHDRKLCVLGLCTLISLGDAKPQVLSEVAGKIVPSLILLFDGLKRAYESKGPRRTKRRKEEEDGR
ncbi:GL22608 [Drosophila persimilis]|uniref:GL22608 n=1 Tax=Drosophila persimilis TaxID=7234 RepID=B4H1G4_DROPE|nr:GL22608 [Drosophila persimilis]